MFVQYTYNFYLTSKIDESVKMPLNRFGQVLLSNLTQKLRNKRIDFILKNPIN